VTRSLEREVDADRFTRLDRMLIAEQRGQEFTDLRPGKDVLDTFRQNRALLIDRARKLDRREDGTEPAFPIILILRSVGRPECFTIATQGEPPRTSLRPGRTLRIRCRARAL
jgi:hypothetical protein